MAAKKRKKNTSMKSLHPGLFLTNGALSPSSDSSSGHYGIFVPIGTGAIIILAHLQLLAYHSSC